MAQQPSCLNCAHYNGDLTCFAYPIRIPLPIQQGWADHTEPKPGDNGITWEPLREEDEVGDE